MLIFADQPIVVPVPFETNAIVRHPELLLELFEDRKPGLLAAPPPLKVPKIGLAVLSPL